MNTKTMHSVVRHTSWRSLDAGPWRISNDRDLINWWVTKIRSKCKRKRLFICRRILNFVVAVIFRTQYVCEMKNKVDRFRIMKPVNLIFYFSLSTICFGREFHYCTFGAEEASAELADPSVKFTDIWHRSGTIQLVRLLSYTLTLVPRFDYDGYWIWRIWSG